MKERMRKEEEEEEKKRFQVHDRRHHYFIVSGVTFIRAHTCLYISLFLART